MTHLSNCSTQQVTLHGVISHELLSTISW